MNLSDQARIERLSIPEPNSGCWLWLGSMKANGYGNMGFNGSFTQAHRVSFMAYKGPIAVGNVICHRCDNPSCVNPDHLWQGTPSQNVRDSIAKGRTAKFHRTVSSKNSSGVIGVGWNKRIQKWKVWFKREHLGYFDDWDEAVSVRKAREISP